MKSLLKATTALALVSFAMPAFAQDAAPADEGAEAPGIVVTAQKREENLQDVPLAVSVIGGEQLANAGGLNLGDQLHFCRLGGL